MNILIDSGTSRLHIGFRENGNIYKVQHLPYPDSDEEMKEILSGKFFNINPESVTVCSVSEIWRESLFTMLENLFPERLILLRSAKDAGVTVNYDKTENFGIDRAVAAYAAFSTIRDCCIVVDAGSAVTVDAITDQGVVAGGFIFPGISMLQQALSDKTGLPLVEDRGRYEEIGGSTVSCIQNGITTGYIAAIEKLIRSARKVVKENSNVILTGGGAEILLPLLPFSVTHYPLLVLDGLGMIADKLNQQT